MPHESRRRSVPNPYRSKHVIGEEDELRQCVILYGPVEARDFTAVKTEIYPNCWVDNTCSGPRRKGFCGRSTMVCIGTLRGGVYIVGEDSEIVYFFLVF